MPKIQLEVFEDLLAIANPRLRDGTLDIYVGRQVPGVTGFDFTYQPLFASSHAVVARQNHPRAECRSLEELPDADWLVALDPQTEGQASYQRFARHGLPMPRSVHFVHLLTVAVALLKRTNMVSAFPWPLVELCAARDGYARSRYGNSLRTRRSASRLAPASRPMPLRNASSIACRKRSAMNRGPADWKYAGQCNR
jgi:DNA-binding transcriptional LysR family regulator